MAIRRASIVSAARSARKSIKRARRLRALIGAADPIEVIFTSCGTEGDNAAIRGMLEARPDKRHIVTTQVEHPGGAGLVPALEKKVAASRGWAWIKTARSTLTSFAPR